MALTDQIAAGASAVSGEIGARTQQTLVSPTDNELLTAMRQMVGRAHLDKEMAGYDFDDVVARRIRFLDDEITRLSKLMNACAIPVNMGG